MWSAVVLARQLIRPQALIGRTRPAQANAGPFISCLDEDHTLILKSDPDGRHGGSRSTPVTIRLRPFDSMDGQARASGKLRLRQPEERPSGAQLSGGDHSLLHRGPASANRRYQPCVAEATRQGAGRTWSGVADARACRQACPMPFAPGVKVPKHRGQGRNCEVTLCQVSDLAWRSDWPGRSPQSEPSWTTLTRATGLFGFIVRLSQIIA